MSKFFDDIRKATPWISREGSANQLDAARMLDAIKASDVLTPKIADSRVHSCRKILLKHSSESRIVFGQQQFGEAAVESYRALRTRLMRLQAANGIRSMVISSAITGEGKTLIAANLAICCGQLVGTRVLLVDADMRTRGLTNILSNLPGPGLGEVLSADRPFEEAILATESPNLYVLGAGNTSVPPPELFATNRWMEFIGWCSETFKVTLIDSPPILPLADFELITSACDAVLIVVRALSTPRELLQKAASQVDAKKLLGAVFNAADLDGHNQYRYDR